MNIKALFLALLIPLACAGATIKGYLLDQSGSAKVGSITIKPMTSPYISGSNYVTSIPFQLTLTNGGFTNTLVQGDYLLLISGTESPIISVPNTNAVYNFIDLINTNGLLYQWKSPGSIVKLDGSDSTFGFLGDKLAFDSIFTLTTNNFGGNESVSVSLTQASLTNALASVYPITGQTVTYTNQISGVITQRVTITKGIISALTTL